LSKIPGDGNYFYYSWLTNLQPKPTIMKFARRGIGSTSKKEERQLNRLRVFLIAIIALGILLVYLLLVDYL
jgi:hypothetical protein